MIASLNLNSKGTATTFQHLKNAAATTVDIDSAGRVALGKIDESDPQARRSSSLTVTSPFGNGDHFEIWNTKQVEQPSADDRVRTTEDLIFGA